MRRKMKMVVMMLSTLGVFVVRCNRHPLHSDAVRSSSRNHRRRRRRRCRCQHHHRHNRRHCHHVIVIESLSSSSKRHRRRRRRCNLCRRHRHRHRHRHHVVDTVLSGAVLLFTVLRIRATLRHRPSVRLGLRQTASQLSTNDDQDADQSSTCSPTAASRSSASGSLRTIKILTFTSIAFFIFWSPYVVVLMVQCFVSSFKPPPAVEFAVMWLANSNSAINVFINQRIHLSLTYSSIPQRTRSSGSSAFCSRRSSAVPD